MEANYQQRSDMAQQFRQWAASQDLPLVQLDQMIQEIMAGNRDATILSATRADAAQQPIQLNVASSNPGIFGGHSPFNKSMQFPTMPDLPGLPLMPAPQMGIMPQIPAFLSMAQPFGSQNSGPGILIGQAFQQFARGPTHQLCANPCYTRSMNNPRGSSSVQVAQAAGQPANVTATQWPTQPIQRHTFAATPVIVHSQPPPVLVQPQHFHPAAPLYQRPYQPQQPSSAPAPAPAPQPPPQQARYRAPHQPLQQPSQPSQEPYHFHFHEPNSEPQNPRLTKAFKRQLSEETYFSTPPGAPGRCVEKPDR